MHSNEDLDDLRELFPLKWHRNLGLASVLVQVEEIQPPFSSSEEILRP